MGRGSGWVVGVAGAGLGRWEWLGGGRGWGSGCGWVVGGAGAGAWLVGVAEAVGVAGALELTVLAFDHSVVVLLPEADVSQMKNPSNQLENRVLLVDRQTHHRHGFLADRK